MTGGGLGLERPDRRAGRGGFTLIELLLSVTLLVLIILVSSYIFDTTIRAVSQTQADNEMSVGLQAFAQLLRNDLRGLEHDGYLICGAREQMAYGSLKDRTNQTGQTFRNDWLMFYTNCEQYSSVDCRVIGQWARILYGHGLVTDKRQALYSNIATDWVLTRHQIILLSHIRLPWSDIQTTNEGPYSGRGIFEGLESPEMGDYVSGWRQYERATLSYVSRDWRWYWFMNYGWEGDLATAAYDFPAYGGGTTQGKAFYEPRYYHTASFYYGWSDRRFHALPHCSDFGVQYAMAEDLRAGPGGATRWRDPPRIGAAGNPIDPNYSATDPQHTNQKNSDGRLAFAPGDRWPVLLKVTVRVFDPMDRLAGGKNLVAVVPVP